MILNTKEDFERAILSGEKIDMKTIFYTGKLVDTCKEEIAIGSLYKGGIYIGSYNNKKCVMALNDESDTLNFYESMELEGCRLPSLIEWMLYLENKETIDKALLVNKGECLQNSYYWSSSEYSDYYAWYVRPSDGNIDWYYKTDAYRVRCILYV